VDIPIVGAAQNAEMVTLAGNPTFVVKPVADTPAGLLGAITQTTFNAADTDTKRAYLSALAAADNPLTHTAETVPCVACHVSTVIMNNRAASTAIDPLALPGRYTSRFDLSTAGGVSAQNQNTLRALGYVGNNVLISQRVVNDTAQTLTEIEARFPGP